MSTKTYTSLTDFQKDYHYDLSDKSTHLGEGSYGQVVKAYDNENNKWVALKIGKDLMKEYEAAQKLNHRNIAKYEACYRINDRNIGQQDYAIMQLYKEGNLATLLKTTTLTEKQRQELVRGILEGLQYLHTQQCIHRDLKPANILISRLPDGNFRPLLADFGLVKVIKEDDFIQTAGSDVVLSDGRGTAVYKSPEQIAGETAHYNLDLWAFGVILYEIMTGERPFKRGTTGSDVRDANILFDQIKNVKIPSAINTIAEPYQAIIRRCLVKDIHKRVRKESELLGMLDEIPQLIQQAEQFEKQDSFENALKLYEKVLRLSPDNTTAKENLEICKGKILSTKYFHWDDFHVRRSWDGVHFFKEDKKYFNIDDKFKRWVEYSDRNCEGESEYFAISNIEIEPKRYSFIKNTVDGKQIKCTIQSEIFFNWAGGNYSYIGEEIHQNHKKYTCLFSFSSFESYPVNDNLLPKYFLFQKGNFRLEGTTLIPIKGTLSELNSEYKELFLKAERCFKNTEWGFALRYYANILSEYPNHSEAIKGYEDCLSAIERNEMEEYVEDRRIEHILEAERLLKQERYFEAKEKFERVLELYPSDDSAQKGLQKCKAAIAKNELKTDSKIEESTDTKKAEEKTDIPPKQEKNSESSKIHKIEYSDDTRNIPNLGIRLLAYIIDTFFVILLNAALLLIIEIRVDSDFISLFNFISFYFYFFICELLWRKSLGKWLFNLKVVVGQTNTSVFIRLLVRTLVRLIPFEALTIFFNKGKCLHDILSKTQVIQRKGSI